jgi:hypothetical protein
VSERRRFHFAAAFLEFLLKTWRRRKALPLLGCSRMKPGYGVITQFLVWKLPIGGMT